MVKRVSDSAGRLCCAVPDPAAVAAIYGPAAEHPGDVMIALKSGTVIHLGNVVLGHVVDTIFPEADRAPEPLGPGL